MVAVAAEKSLVGTWMLLSREDVTSDGQRRAEPILGSNPLAYLMYDTAGHFAVQFMRRDRGVCDGVAEQAGVGGVKNSGAVNGYDAYFGKYSIGDDGTVTQELIGALSPEDVGKIVTRRFQIKGAELVITLETTARDGEAVTRTLRWQRAG